MSFSTWLIVVGVCLAGAISPGPSLALVVQASLASNRTAGFLVSVSHGAGIFIWALFTASGMGLVLVEWPEIYSSLQIIGCFYLLYLGGRGLLTAKNNNSIDTEDISVVRPVMDGFLIAITNPKIALFFLALFSQFVRVEADWSEKIIMASTAAVIDTMWYCLVALTVSNSLIVNNLRDNKLFIDRAFAMILIALACYVLITNVL